MKSTTRYSELADPLHREALSQRHVKPVVMSLVDRVASGYAGYVEGRVERRSGVAADDVEAISTAWLERNQHSCHETQQRDLLNAAASVARDSQKLDEAARRILALDSDSLKCAAEIAELEKRPMPTIESAPRGPGERGHEDSVVLERRRRVHDMPLVAARQLDRDLSKERVANLHSALSAHARVQTVWSMALIREERTRAYYNRRAEIYRRQFVRALKGRQRSLGALDRGIPVAEWVSRSNPWVPDSFRTLASMTTSKEI